ncbi:MAG: hypothetical protein ACK4TP_13400 [Hyphomicrobium sp.]
MTQDKSSDDAATLARQVRLIVLLEAARSAGLTPIDVVRLHTLAYLSNVLSQVWDMPPMDGKILKRRGGPFYPAMQADLDRLVGMGLVLLGRVGHRQDEDGRWRLEGEYRLNSSLAAPVLDAIRRSEAEARTLRYVKEIAFALAGLDEAEIDRAVSEDATYADPAISPGNVVDFGEWQRWQEKNYSANASLRLGDLLPSGRRASTGEQLHLYVRHLHRRMHGGRG